MRVPAPFDIAARGSPRLPPPLPRMAEKTSDSSQLNAGARDFTQHGRGQRPKTPAACMCRGETKAFDPFWDGPRLKPSFVAQVLGQAMTDRRERRAAARAAYCRAASPSASRLDKSI